MKKDIFSNQANPFTVPDGYFDTLQERIMSSIEAEDNLVRTRGNMRTLNIRTMLAAAACVLFIFTGATLYMRYSEPQFMIAESVLDDDFTSGSLRRMRRPCLPNH